MSSTTMVGTLAAAAPEGTLLDSLQSFVTANWDTLATLVVVPLVLMLVGRYLASRTDRHLMTVPMRQAWMIGLSCAGLLWIILTLDDADQADLLKLLGILLSAAVAFSSTTLIGNALAGFMLRAQRHFGLNDYLQVDDYFGSVSERGIFFTEIQNEAADLVTLPNSYLLTRPVTVWQKPSTLINTEVSLGYDVPRSEVKRLLLEAAEAAELEHPFVYIQDLGDFSVTYRVTGRLKDTRELLTARSRLRGRVLDALHAGGVEIVSPAFMNQRVLAADRAFIPKVRPMPDEPDEAPEIEMFAKAVKAASLERLKEMVSELEERIREIKSAIGSAGDADERARLRVRLESRQHRQERLLEAIREREAAEKDG